MNNLSKAETKLQSEQKTAEDGFKEKLAIEILARFTGSSRGTPIAKQGFIDGALWAASQFKSSVVGENDREHIAQILRDNITFSGQVGDYVIHGAIDKIIQWANSRVGEKEEQRFTIEDMVAFAAYLHDHSWEYDYREEKTHSLLEHLDEWTKTRKQ